MAGEMETRVLRFINSIPWWAAYVLALIGIVMVGIQGLLHPDRWIVIFLLVVAAGWAIMAGFWSHLAKSSIGSQQRMLDGNGVLIDYTNDVNKIMQDALNALATYDRDRAVQLAHDLNALASRSMYDWYWKDELRKEEDGGVGRA